MRDHEQQLLPLATRRVRGNSGDQVQPNTPYVDRRGLQYVLSHRHPILGLAGQCLFC